MTTQKEIKSRLLSALSNLKRGQAKSLSELAEETETHEITVRKNLEEIELVQNFDKIEITNTKSRTFIKISDENILNKRLSRLEKKLDKIVNILETIQ